MRFCSAQTNEFVVGNLGLFVASSADLDTLFELSYKIHPRKGKKSPTNGNGRDPNA